MTINHDAKSRAGVFFIAPGFGFAQVTSNVLANMISAGNDSAAMFPRFDNIRRGGILVISLSFPINPWQLSKSSFAFTNYLGSLVFTFHLPRHIADSYSYQILLSSILGVVLYDYFFVKKGYLKIDDLFSSSKEGLYHYRGGWNRRAYVAYIAGIVLNFPGFLDSVGLKRIPVAAVRLYYLALPVGIFVSAAVYCPLCLWKPPPGGMATRLNKEYGVSSEADLMAEYGSGDNIEGVPIEQASVKFTEKT